MKDDPTVYEVWLTIPPKIRKSFQRFWAGEIPLRLSYLEKLNTDQKKVFYYYSMLFRSDIGSLP